jgi:hypothetical protein
LRERRRNWPHRGRTGFFLRLRHLARLPDRPGGMESIRFDSGAKPRMQSVRARHDENLFNRFS